MAANTRSAQDVIAALNLSPHPEKGYFIETHRDGTNGTAIYYLLEKDAGRSHWHKVTNATEIWHHYAGAPLRLGLAWDDGATPVRHVVLGQDLWRGERPQVVVQVGEWQCATTLGDWTLVGCTVSPSFSMDHFVMADEGWEPNTGGTGNDDDDARAGSK
ncbi:hypothetical protein PFICI_03082 [Pestalotiopsis fici W106-1]|uniref:DUF985 domain-containing protein n=1 Tax=Pestalotiopsis fici (strain W106-1 / CGMCC3.15140) TaxID=1229662 RepID=W3XHZ1_PESFW|nr:uncharacterized protein PFICI_03082 [Pestalotiopsis fici W106-1]ETS85057.1 hypothetical protein PFICI_03082 [Pestalotiopsis fici W106-1]